MIHGNRLIFPLDVPSWPEAARLVQTLVGHVGYFKVGLELFTKEGPEAIGKIRQLASGGVGVFLDLKLHDIPATVGRAMANVAGLNADLVTVHASGGRAMLQAAKEKAGSSKVLAVTVLTSIDLTDRPQIFNPAYSLPGDLVRVMAETALDAGCDGLVCSGKEVAFLRKEFGLGPLLVVPGIRPAWSLVAGDDQKRIVTPTQAIQAGADLLVVGRPIRDAMDPGKAADMVVQEMAI